jgi:glucose/arabinose dehydrogenase/PKD repeat protein
MIIGASHWTRGTGVTRERVMGAGYGFFGPRYMRFNEQPLGARTLSSVAVLSLGLMAGRTKQLLRVGVVLAAAVLAATLVTLLPSSGAGAVPTLPAGFQDSIVFSGLTNPTAVQFSKDGRVFVAEKSGLIKVFDNLSDTTPTTFADLRTNVHNFWDRGLLGLALDPNFPTNPYVYVLYTYDAPIGGTAPKWGTVGATSDTCPSPPGATADGCVVSGRLSRLQAAPNTNTMTGNEQVLIEDWCQQYPSHSIGSLVFGSDGALYVSGGEGANFNLADYGQGGGSSGSPTPKNPCGDPDQPVGGTLSPPKAEGGALRSQDLRTSGDPVGLNGAILRVDPATGNALPNNPLISNSDTNARRIIAYGLRNPFRQTLVARPGTDEIWVGDVGWAQWEEINRIANPTDSTVENFGWPCYEGDWRPPGYDDLNLNICENLYGQANAVSAPHFAYVHGTQVAGESCATGNGSSISGLAFYKGGPYPDEYDDALFFSDYSRGCIWVMEKGTNGLPNPGQLKPFVTGAASPVDLQIGPNGDLFYVDFDQGTIRRVQYSVANQPPIARATANPTSGAVPLAVSFDGTGSSDPEGSTLTYEWDLDGDGAFDDSTSSQPTYTYDTAGDYQVGLRVTDGQGASDTLDQPLTISAGNTAPTATINSPSSTTTWKVGDNISFSGSATDQEDGSLAASSLTWSLIMHHCSSQNSCHEHRVQDFAGVASGSFVAPDHEYPSYLELRLTATDSGGLSGTKSVRLDPKTVELSFRSDPAGLQLTVGSASGTTPFSRTVIVGSKNSISAPSPQTLAGTSYEFASWSDGGAQSHDIVAPDAANAYTATYTAARNEVVARINTGGPAVTTSGATWDADQYFSGGTSFTNNSIADIAGTTDDELYKSEHTSGANLGSFSYAIPVPASATYTVKLHFAEIWWGAAGGDPGGVGKRVFSVNLEGGATELANYDIYAEAGATKAVVKSYDMAVSDGTLNIAFTASTDRPTIEAIEVLKAGSSPADTTPPTVSSTVPSDRVSGVPVGINTEATFSEAMNASTVNANTFTLTKQGASTPVTATVSYDATTKKATLDPSADLEAGATYTATVKGGASGVKDLAGNPLASDKTWSFTTAAPALSAPSNLAAVRGGPPKAQRIDLSWMDNSNSEAKFVIERSTTPFSAPSNLVTYEVGANATSYRDTAVQAKTTYYYRVFAVSSVGVRSAPSNVASVTTK